MLAKKLEVKKHKILFAGENCVGGPKNPKPIGKMLNPQPNLTPPCEKLRNPLSYFLPKGPPLINPRLILCPLFLNQFQMPKFFKGSPIPTVGLS